MQGAARGATGDKRGAAFKRRLTADNDLCERPPALTARGPFS